jgi:hypothetical protein
MNAILAQLDPSAAPKGLPPWLECLFWFGAFVLCMGGLVKMFKGKSPEPPNQQLEATINDLKAGLQEVKEDNTKIWQAIDANLKLTEAANEKRAHDIHIRLNPAAEDIAEVKGQMKAFTLSFENFTRIITSLAQGKKQ